MIMKIIKRDIYLNKLIQRKDNGMIKVITGIRRCGKSFLLFELYYKYLIGQGVKRANIIRIPLDDDEYEELLDKKKLREYINKKISGTGKYYIFLDEIQLVDEFEKVLNGLNRRQNLDIYVTGSNSKFLSTDVLTEFRGRGDEVRVRPFTFSEYLKGYDGTIEDAWNEYFTYGGMPVTLSLKTDEQKSEYLKKLFQETYQKDIVDRYKVTDPEKLERTAKVIASSTGSLTNPTKLAKTFESNGYGMVTNKTINSYINYMQDAFLIEKVERYDVKGRKYISTPSKYYFSDIGLRNAYLNFRQQEENHIMENVIYNELRVRGYNVDVGVVEHELKDNDGNRKKKQLEVDFICNKGSLRYYIQSAYALPDEAKRQQEKESLIHIKDMFKKIIIVKDNIKLYRDEDGIVTIGLREFLTNPNSLEL